KRRSFSKSNEELRVSGPLERVRLPPDPPLRSGGARSGIRLAKARRHPAPFPSSLRAHPREALLSDSPIIIMRRARGPSTRPHSPRPWVRLPPSHLPEGDRARQRALALGIASIFQR